MTLLLNLPVMCLKQPVSRITFVTVATITLIASNVELVEEPVATDGPNVELYRMVVKARPNTDYTTCVRFTDLDNKVVSLGFDGRYDIDEESDFRKCYSYGIYADCSVIDGEGRQLTKAGDLQTIRNLRDALNKLNLGD